MFFDHYPYTNFHNVNLDWVLQAVKAWGRTVEANDQAFKDLEEANESFKAYVTNYLQDLDVSDEINTKLDRMLAEGTLTPYFAPYVKGYVESWLASNVTPTTPALDKTLSISDAAADAAATGEKIVRASFLRTLDDPELYKVINKNHILPGYRIQSACHALGYFFVCGGSEAEDGSGFIAKMSDLDFKDAEITYIQGLGHANDITYSNTDHYLYITTVGEGVEWGIVKINPNDFTDRTLITNCPYNTIGIQYVAGWMYILAPYRIYRTLNFETYDLVIENTNDILNKFGIPERGSQTLVRVQDDILGWVGTYMSEPEHRWHGFIVYFGSDRPITFELFPTYNAECQAGVWDGHSVYFICNGTTSPAYTILKTDLLNLKYHLLGTGKNLNDYYGEGIYYLIGAATMDNCPVNNEGLTLHVSPQGLLNTRQDIYTNSGRHLYRIKLFNAGTWGEWVEQAAEIAEIKEDLSVLENKAGNLKPLNLFNVDYTDETHTFYGWQQYSVIDANTGLVVDTTSKIGTTYKIPTYGSTTVDCRYGSAQLNFTVRNMACYDINNRYLGFADLISTGYYTLKNCTAYIIIEKTYGSNPAGLHNNFCVNPSWGAPGVFHSYTNPILTSSLNLMQIFPKYTTIGDSLMCGFVNNSATSVSSANARAAGNNWPTYIAKRTGLEFTNIAVGGSTTGQWRSTHIDTANVDTNCYLVGLGMNDLRQSLDIGTSADIASNYTENADSFYGNYDFIIRQLAAWKPAAHIMCFTIPTVEPHDATGYNDAIKYIASLYPDKVHVIDLTGYTSEYNNMLIAKNFIANHYNPIAYNMMSSIIEKAINTFMYYNYSLFLGAPYV